MDRWPPHPVRLSPQSFCDQMPATAQLPTTAMYRLPGWRLESEIQESLGLVPPGAPGANLLQASLSSEWFLATLGVRSPWLHCPKLCLLPVCLLASQPSYEDLSPDQVGSHHLSSSAMVLFPRKVTSDVPGRADFGRKPFNPPQVESVE